MFRIRIAGIRSTGDTTAAGELALARLGGGTAPGWTYRVRHRSGFSRVHRAYENGTIVSVEVG